MAYMIHILLLVSISVPQKKNRLFFLALRGVGNMSPENLYKKPKWCTVFYVALS